MQECCDKLVCLPEVCDPATQWKYLDLQTMLTRVSAPCSNTPRISKYCQQKEMHMSYIPARLCRLLMHDLPLAPLPRPKKNDGTLLGSTFEQCNAQDLSPITEFRNVMKYWQKPTSSERRLCSVLCKALLEGAVSLFSAMTSWGARGVFEHYWRTRYGDGWSSNFMEYLD